MSIKRLSGAGLTTPKSNRLWDQVTFQSGMFALATINLTSNQSSVTFSGIPNTYTHLQLRVLSNCSSASSGAVLRFNGDTNANYKGHGIYSSGSGVGVTDTSLIYAPNFMGGGVTTPGIAIIDILDYASTSKTKVVRSLDGYDANGSGYAALSSGYWTTSNAAIHTISLSFTNLLAGSHFALYGIKAA